MMVHSFDQSKPPSGLTEYREFVQCLTKAPVDAANRVSGPYQIDSIQVYFVWVNGDPKWLADGIRLK